MAGDEGKRKRTKEEKKVGSGLIAKVCKGEGGDCIPMHTAHIGGNIPLVKVRQFSSDTILPVKEPVKLVVGQPATGNETVNTQEKPQYSGNMTPSVSKKYGTSENIPKQLKKKGQKVKYY